jgi:hypothetical protein
MPIDGMTVRQTRRTLAPKNRKGTFLGSAIELVGKAGWTLSVSLHEIPLEGRFFSCSPLSAICDQAYPARGSAAEPPSKAENRRLPTSRCSSHTFPGRFDDVDGTGFIIRLGNLKRRSAFSPQEEMPCHISQATVRYASQDRTIAMLRIIAKSWESVRPKKKSCASFWVSTRRCMK